MITRKDDLGAYWQREPGIFSSNSKRIKGIAYPVNKIEIEMTWLRLFP